MAYTFDQIFEYIRNFPLDFWDRKEELRWLHEIAIRWCYAHPNTNIDILELGTYTGVSAICLAGAMFLEKINDYNLTTIDKCLYADSKTVSNNIARANKDLGLHIRFSESDDIEYLNTIADKSIDLLYIDTLHTLEHMNEILPLCLTKMKNGGLLFGHDYTPEFSGVVEAVSDFRQVCQEQIIGNGQDYSIWWSLIR